MNYVAQAVPSVPIIRITGAIAILSGIISAIGVVLLIAMFASTENPIKILGYRVGTLNDIFVTIQYILAVPLAVALYRILSIHSPALVRAATIAGILSMLAIIILQVLLISKVLTFDQQGLWVSLAMLIGVGSWLVITGLVARSTGRLPHSLLISILAVPYFGYPVWAFWLGLHLLSW